MNQSVCATKYQSAWKRQAVLGASPQVTGPAIPLQEVPGAPHSQTECGQRRLGGFRVNEHNEKVVETAAAQHSECAPCPGVHPTVVSLVSARL